MTLTCDYTDLLQQSLLQLVCFSWKWPINPITSVRNKRIETSHKVSEYYYLQVLFKHSMFYIVMLRYNNREYLRLIKKLINGLVESMSIQCCRCCHLVINDGISLTFTCACLLHNFPSVNVTNLSQ